MSGSKAGRILIEIARTLNGCPMLVGNLEVNRCSSWSNQVREGTGRDNGTRTVSPGWRMMTPELHSHTVINKVILQCYSVAELWLKLNQGPFQIQGFGPAVASADAKPA